MTHTICHGVYGSGVWTSGIASDFTYRNNVIDHCNYVWTAQGGASALADSAGRGGRQAGAAPAPAAATPISYQVVGSYFANNRRLAGSGTGARLEYADLDPSFLKLSGTTVTEQPVVFEHDESRRHYLHPVTGSEAAAIGAGLFTKPLA
jgi:hypothetical protein